MNVLKLFLAGCLFSSAAMARSQNGDQLFMFNQTDNVSIRLNGYAIDKSYLATDPQNTLPSITNLGDSTLNGISSAINTSLGDQLKTIPGYRSHQSNLNGSLYIDIVKGITRISGLNLTAGVNLHYEKYGGLVQVDCHANFQTSTFDIFAILDSVNGVFKNVSMDNFSVKATEDCSSNWDWVPFIGNYLSHIATDVLKGKIDTNLDKLYTHMTAQFKAVSFGSLNLALPDAKFVIAGVDLGKQIRLLLQYQLDSSMIRLVLGRNVFRDNGIVYRQTHLYKSSGFALYIYNQNVSVIAGKSRLQCFAEALEDCYDF